MALHTFELNREFIELNVLLKLLALSPSGGAAKTAIAAGLVSVDGEVETRRARKLKSGQVVRLGNDEIHVVAAAKDA